MTRQQQTNGSSNHAWQDADLAVLRLAATAIDVRSMLTPQEISRRPALENALSALDDLFRECYGDGGRQNAQPGAKVSLS